VGGVFAFLELNEFLDGSPHQNKKNVITEIIRK